MSLEKKKEEASMEVPMKVQEVLERLPGRQKKSALEGAEVSFGPGLDLGC